MSLPDILAEILAADPHAIVYPGRTGRAGEWTEDPVIVADWHAIPTELANRAESAGAELDWCDEVYACDDCGHVVTTSPQHFWWTPSYAWEGDCVILCFTCCESRGLRWTEGHYGQRIVDPDVYRDRSISSGTTRPEDVVPAMVSALFELGFSEALWDKAHDEFRTFEKTAPRLVSAVLYAAPGSEEERAAEVAENIARLWDILDQAAPEGCYFGAHPDDRADFGFWEIGA